MCGCDSTLSTRTSSRNCSSSSEYMTATRRLSMTLTASTFPDCRCTHLKQLDVLPRPICSLSVYTSPKLCGQGLALASPVEPPSEPPFLAPASASASAPSARSTASVPLRTSCADTGSYGSWPSQLCGRR